MHLSLILAHRLRGLITSIEGFADMLTDTLGTQEQRELLLRIFEGTSRVEQILADLQHYSQPIRPVRRRLAVMDLVDDLTLVAADGERGTVRIEPPVGGGTLQADPRLMCQALLVLVQNALDATRPQAEAVVRTTCRDGVARFEVWNAGVIDLEEAERRVFIPFFTTKAHNLGVGLSIARQIAEAHDGRLALTRNDPAEGTCFALCVPLHDDLQRAVDPTDQDVH